MEDKLDKIAEDVAYMRGRWDSTVPDLVKRTKDLEDDSVKNKISWGKVTALSSMVGFIGSSLLTFFTSHK